jgi:DNA-binding MarR family transcriptional regulator
MIMRRRAAAKLVAEPDVEPTSGPRAALAVKGGNGIGTEAGTEAEQAICPQAADEALLRTWFQLHSSIQVVTSDLFVEVERGCGLTAPEFRVLWHLRDQPERRAAMNEISRLLNFSTAGTTKLIDRLSGMGLVQRRTNHCDRRVILAELTETGEGSAGVAASILVRTLRERFLGRLGEDRVTALVEAFALLGEGSSGDC